ncbi:MAG: hypothetical protein KC736_01285 [Candidatus Moranbacteria bacterium]|nr:hypothetical protein [Candidatus Moranbacteria bacterium]
MSENMNQTKFCETREGVVGNVCKMQDSTPKQRREEVDKLTLSPGTHLEVVCSMGYCEEVRRQISGLVFYGIAEKEFPECENLDNVLMCFRIKTTRDFDQLRSGLRTLAGIAKVQCAGERS